MGTGYRPWIQTLVADTGYKLAFGVKLTDHRNVRFRHWKQTLDADPGYRS